MLKMILIAGAILLAIAIIIPVAIYYSSDARERKYVPALPAAQTPVTASVPLPLAQVRARLLAKFGAEFSGPNSCAQLSHPEYGPQFQQFSILPNENGNIDGQFRSTNDGGMSSDAPISTKRLDLQTQDPGLPSYLQLPIPERQHDLQIQARSNWTASDMQKDGKTLPYSSDYFIHFKSLKPNETEITILGFNATVVDGKPYFWHDFDGIWSSFNATVVDGKRWSVIGDVFFTAPRRVDNFLATPPSPADKRAMLENLLKLLE